jgi:hypothetical protein
MRPTRARNEGAVRAITAVLTVLAFCSAAASARAERRHLRLETDELSVKERLALPFFKVAVGPDRPLTLLGRDRPLTFRESDGKLYAEVGIGLGPPADTEREIVPGERVLALIKQGAGCVGWVFVPLVFFQGDPERGEPRWYAVSLRVLTLELGRKVLRFVDHDCDGRHLTPYRDLILSAKGPPMAVAPAVVLHREVWKLEYEEEDRPPRPDRSVWAEPDPEFRDREIFPRWTDVVDGLTYLNELRAGMGLPPVALDREASRAAMLHVRYLERNGGNGHVERRDFPGYSREGAEAALRSIGHLGPGSVRTAIDGHLASLLHRMELIDPRNTRMGIASAGSRVWIYTDFGEKRPWEDQGPVIFPGPNGRWGVGSYSGENPDPRPESHRGATGLPVTVGFFDSEGILEVRAELFRGRTQPDAWRKDADHRDLATNHDALRAAIMTEKPLRSGAHRLVVTWKQDGRPCRLEHVFRIGR